MAPKQRKNRGKSLMHTDIKDLEIGRKLRALGEIRVTQWELSDVFPAVRELANKEVDVAGFLWRTANYKVFEWDFRKALNNAENEPDHKASVADTQSCIDGASQFLRYVCDGLLGTSQNRHLEVVQRMPSDYRLLLVLPRKDAAALIGHGGHTAGAMRHLVEDAGLRIGLNLDLKIMTDEEWREANHRSPSPSLPLSENKGKKRHQP